MTDAELKRCIASFEATRPICKRSDVYLNVKADQYTQGFKLLPYLTHDWREFRSNWEARLSGKTARINSGPVGVPDNIDEDLIEKAYWDYDDLRTKPRPGFGPMPERDAFKYIVRRLIRDHQH